MTLCELTRDRKVLLKQRMIVDENENYGIGTSWEELADADRLVSDERLEERYGDAEFSEGDFD